MKEGPARWEDDVFYMDRDITTENIGGESHCYMSLHGSNPDTPNINNRPSISPVSWTLLKDIST